MSKAFKNQMKRYSSDDTDEETVETVEIVSLSTVPVKTGDNTPLLLYALVALISGEVAVLAWRQRRQ